MVKKAKKTSKKKVAVKTVVKVTAAATKTTGNPEGHPVPSCIAELRAIAKKICAMTGVPEKHDKAMQRIIDGCNKTADKIYNGLDSEEKKAERDAKAKVRAVVKAKRDAAKTDKKRAKIKKLKEQLAALEAPVIADAK